MRGKPGIQTHVCLTPERGPDQPLWAASHAVVITTAVYGASIMGQPCPEFFTFLLLYQTSSFIRHLRGHAFQGQFYREEKKRHREVG